MEHIHIAAASASRPWHISVSSVAESVKERFAYGVCCIYVLWLHDYMDGLRYAWICRIMFAVGTVGNYQIYTRWFRVVFTRSFDKSYGLIFLRTFSDFIVCSGRSHCVYSFSHAFDEEVETRNISFIVCGSRIDARITADIIDV